MAFDLSQHMSMSKLIRFTLPTIFMMIFTSLYTIVDGILSRTSQAKPHSPP